MVCTHRWASGTQFRVNDLNCSVILKLFFESPHKILAQLNMKVFDPIVKFFSQNFLRI